MSLDRAIANLERQIVRLKERGLDSVAQELEIQLKELQSLESVTKSTSTSTDGVKSSDSVTKISNGRNGMTITQTSVSGDNVLYL